MAGTEHSPRHHYGPIDEDEPSPEERADLRQAKRRIEQRK
jgi:hypothetical protein